MKKAIRVVAAVMLLCMVLTLCACGQDGTTTGPKATVPTTTQTVPVATTTVPPTTVDDGLVEYTVTVLYPDGTPVAGKIVVVCNDVEGGTCSLPTKTDENGVAVIRMEEGEKMGAKMTSKIDGYEKMTEYAYFENGSREVTITLVPVA